MRFLTLLFFCFLLAGCSIWDSFQGKSSTASTVAAVKTSETLSTLPAGSPQNIALLVPLDGSLANAGQAVRDGFLTAYQNDKTTSKPAHISVIDTTKQPIQEAYKQAVQDGADFVVGPLAKNELQTLINAGSINEPTLALNYLDSSQTAPSNLYQYGLSPLDEARQSAALAWQNGLHHAVIMAPRSAWGKTVAQAFQNEWQALGGDVVTQLFYTDSGQSLNESVRNLLSKYQKHIDVIFLAADPTTARQVKPLLKFYDADNIPIYATALVYAGTPNPTFDRDLNGVTFCDAPWVLADSGAAAQLRQQISVFWPVNFQQNGRLYALGVDAYQLSKQLSELAASTDETLDGTTGVLSLDSQHRVVRQLTCAQFQRGKPAIITQAVAPLNAENNEIIQDASIDG